MPSVELLKATLMPRSQCPCIYYHVYNQGFAGLLRMITSVTLTGTKGKIRAGAPAPGFLVFVFHIIWQQT